MCGEDPPALFCYQEIAATRKNRTRRSGEIPPGRLLLPAGRLSCGPLGLGFTWPRSRPQLNLSHIKALTATLWLSWCARYWPRTKDEGLGDDSLESIFHCNVALAVLNP